MPVTCFGPVLSSRKTNFSPYYRLTRQGKLTSLVEPQTLKLLKKCVYSLTYSFITKRHYCNTK